MPTDARRPGPRVTERRYIFAESRVLAALEPWLRQQSETFPSWAHARPPLHTMIDAMNRRITYDPGTDSIHVTTGVGGSAAMEQAGRCPHQGRRNSVSEGRLAQIGHAWPSSS